MSQPNRKTKRIVLTVILVGIALLYSGCSFTTRFKLKNSSGQHITVRYEFKDISAGFTPHLVLKNPEKNKPDSVAFPSDRIKIDKEKGLVEFKLMPDEEAILAQLTDRPMSEYEEVFNLKNFRVEGVSGTVFLEGRQVFQAFEPIKAGWPNFGPEIIGFRFEYK